MSNNVEKKELKETAKTPVSVVLDMARSEIGNHTFSCMQNNHIPPALMVYILKDVLLDVYQMKAEKMSEEFVEIQRVLNEGISEEVRESQEG